MRYLRHILAILAMMGCLAAYAQSDKNGKYVEAPLYDSSRPEKFLDLKAHFLVGGSSAVNNYKSAIPGLMDMQFSPGALFRPGFEVDFKIRNSLAIGTGFEFGIHNTRCALSVVDANTSSINSIYIKNHFYNINIPVFLSFRLNMGRRIKCVIDIGGYMAYGLTGKARTSGYASGQNSLGQQVIYHLFYKRDYYDEKNSVVNSVRRSDYGPRLSAGVLYRGHYSFNWVFQMSARNLAVNHNVLDVKYRHLSLGFEVGYIF